MPKVRDFNPDSSNTENEVFENPPVEPEKPFKGFRCTASTSVVNAFNLMAENNGESTGLVFEMLWECFINQSPEEKNRLYDVVTARYKKSKQW